MNAWLFLWLMLGLKIPLVALFLIVRWAVRQAPEAAPGSDGGIGPPLTPRHPHHPRSRPPRPPRRGPHGEPPVSSPARVRAFAGRKRLPAR
ncbi:MAG TPA: hypothetical protein VH115_08920 [Solirubrobacteraceae bacterium]|nr:hypothetical protein [Solirubrobacteraceae bacterium]